MSTHPTVDHAFTAVWRGAKPSELIARLICKCVYREGGKHCLRSWAEHGKPATSEWRWVEMEMHNAIAEMPFGIIDPSWLPMLSLLNPTERMVFDLFALHRNALSGLSSVPVALIQKLTRRNRSTITRAVAKLVKVGLLTLIHKHSGRKDGANVYLLPPTLRRDEIMAAKAKRERNATATASPKPGATPRIEPPGAKAHADVLSAPVTAEEREASAAALEKIRDGLNVKRIPREYDDARAAGEAIKVVPR